MAGLTPTFGHIPTRQQRIMRKVSDSCVTKALVSGVGGFALGALFGGAMGGFDSVVPSEAALEALQKATLGARALEGVKVACRSAWATGKAFGGLGLLYSGTECSIEKFRARSDIWNQTLAGCATGAMLAVRTGPKAMAVGCAGFASFSFVMEFFLGGHYKKY